MNTIARCLTYWPNVSRVTVANSLVVVMIIGLISLTFAHISDDVRLLQASSRNLVAQENAVDQLVATMSDAQYFVLEAHSEQSLLLLEEQLVSRLQPMSNEGAIAGYLAVSSWVPSDVRQTLNHSLLQQQVYSENGLGNQLAVLMGEPQLAGEMVDFFNNSPAKKITVQEWINHSFSEPYHFLWLGEKAGRYYSIVGLTGISSDSVSRLETIANDFQGIHFVDEVSIESKVLKNLRLQLELWIVVAYLIVLLLLAWRYRASTWRVIAAPALSSVLTLGLLTFSGSPINIFNLLALLLVLGIGLDASIFLRESGRTVHTWSAVTLAALTTLLAFGLLAWSQTPVLHHFGITVLLGILGVWLLAPCFVEEKE